MKIIYKSLVSQEVEREKSKWASTCTKMDGFFCELTANKMHVSFSQVSDKVKVGCSHQTV